MMNEIKNVGWPPTTNQSFGYSFLIHRKIHRNLKTEAVEKKYTSEKPLKNHFDDGVF